MISEVTVGEEVYREIRRKENKPDGIKQNEV